MLALKPIDSCVYDEISLGEVMLRLDPGEGRIRCARSFKAWEGGGEYNVAKALRKCFQMKTATVTALADNDIGYLIEDFMMEGGVDTRFIKWAPYDGIGGKVRNGLNFTERGFGARGAIGVSDRANSAASQLKPGDMNWETIFGQFGTRWFHTGGIFSALSETTAKTALEAVECAKKYDAAVSYDFNFRPSLWKDRGGKAKAQEVNRELVKYADVIIGGEADFKGLLGPDAPVSGEGISFSDREGYKEIAEAVSAAYPNLKVIASALRKVKSATVNDWSAVCWADGQVYTGMSFEGLEIFDRVGGGDGFAAGLIYGLLNGLGMREALNYGVCHGALVMSTPGDTSMAIRQEVEDLMKGAGAGVQR